MLAVFDQAIEDMRAAGAEVIDPANIASMDNANVFSELPTRVLDYEFKANINKYFRSLGPRGFVDFGRQRVASLDPLRRW